MGSLSDAEAVGKDSISVCCSDRLECLMSVVNGCCERDDKETQPLLLGNCRPSHITSEAIVVTHLDTDKP